MKTMPANGPAKLPPPSQGPEQPTQPSAPDLLRTPMAGPHAARASARYRASEQVLPDDRELIIPFTQPSPFAPGQWVRTPDYITIPYGQVIQTAALPLHMNGQLYLPVQLTSGETVIIKQADLKPHYVHGACPSCRCRNDRPTGFLNAPLLDKKSS